MSVGSLIEISSSPAPIDLRVTLLYDATILAFAAVAAEYSRQLLMLRCPFGSDLSIEASAARSQLNDEFARREITRHSAWGVREGNQFARLFNQFGQLTRDATQDLTTVTCRSAEPVPHTKVARSILAPAGRLNTLHSCVVTSEKASLGSITVRRQARDATTSRQTVRTLLTTRVRSQRGLQAVQILIPSVEGQQHRDVNQQRMAPTPLCQLSQDAV